jgi:hypothetical protein
MTEITFPAPSRRRWRRDDPGPRARAVGAGPRAGRGPVRGHRSGRSGTGDLDELAHKLYDRIRWRMRSELRLDMERAGLGAGTTR